MTAHATALIADDEPLLRDALRRQLATAWPELEIVAEARNGREALRHLEQHPALGEGVGRAVHAGLQEADHLRVETIERPDLCDPLGRVIPAAT